ncbi:MAG: hypothetical protein WHS43_03055 [Aquificaceae bacterium]|uniref:hypothetical protein n=1 Tax=Hydrogenobacter sp. Uz 6-8 TaxID=3384828 RepID=UPI00309886E1
MRFYGIASEERILEIVERITDGVWVYEDNGKREELDVEGAKKKLLELVNMVKGWKEESRHIPAGTTFFFVSTPESPQAVKVYDLSSLGCSSSLSPARWKVYRKELEGQL